MDVRLHTISTPSPYGLHINSGSRRYISPCGEAVKVPRGDFGAGADLPVDLLGRLRSDRVMLLPAPPRRPGTNGRPRKHGRELALSDPAACPDPQVTTSTATTRYGTAVAAAWDRVHPRLTRRVGWLDHDGPLPVIEGTLIRLQVDYLPGDRDPKPVWLW